MIWYKRRRLSRTEDNILSVRSSNEAAVVNICGGSCGIGGGPCAFVEPAPREGPPPGPNWSAWLSIWLIIRYQGVTVKECALRIVDTRSSVERKIGHQEWKDDASRYHNRPILQH